MDKIIIEARINEYAMRDSNPNVPWTPDEIAEAADRCRDAGAAILHFHGRDDRGGADNSIERYRDIITKVRERNDILILPTLGFISNDVVAERRIDWILELSKTPETKIDIAPIDVGSANLELYDVARRAFTFADRLYQNRTDTLIHYAQNLRAAGVKPKLVSWSIGFTRRAMAMADAGLVDEPLYVLFHMTEGPYITGHPATAKGLEAHLSALPENHSIVWTTNVLGGNLLALAPLVCRKGGNLAIGIGDYPYPELGAPRNDAVIREAVRIARAEGREPASPAEARALLHLQEDSSGQRSPLAQAPREALP